MWFERRVGKKEAVHPQFRLAEESREYVDQLVESATKGGGLHIPLCCVTGIGGGLHIPLCCVTGIGGGPHIPLCCVTGIGGGLHIPLCCVTGIGGGLHIPLLSFSAEVWFQWRTVCCPHPGAKHNCPPLHPLPRLIFYVSY